MTLYELCQHDVISVSTGANLGKVDDLSFDDKTASVLGIVKMCIRDRSWSMSILKAPQKSVLPL